MNNLLLKKKHFAVLGVGFILATARIDAAPADSKAASNAPTPAPAASSASSEFFDEHPPDADAEQVIKTIQLLTDELSKRDFDAMKTHMDEGCSTFDESTHKLVSGRDNILADVKKNLSAEPNIIGFSINRPFAKVTGDTAVANFWLVKEVGGNHPGKFECHCTDIFVKRDGEWKKLHFRGNNYKPMKPAEG